MQHTTAHKHYTQQQQQIQSQPTLQTIFYDFRDCLCFSRFFADFQDCFPDIKK